MPTDLQEETSPDDSYAYKASLIGSAHLFELTKKGLSWKVGARSEVWAYTDISAINLSFRPSFMQSQPLCADIRHVNGGRLKVMPTKWQTVSLMAPQDHGYRAFITELHRRMAAAGSRAKLSGGLSGFYGAAWRCSPFLPSRWRAAGSRARDRRVGRRAVPARFCRAVLLADRRLFRRNRPISYSFDQLPKALLPWV